MQIELAIHDVEWCRHGHPVLVLKESSGDRKLAIALNVEDAQDLFRDGQRGSGRARVCAMVLALLDNLDATLDTVTLAVGSGDVLNARLHIDKPGGELLLTINASDGLVLAQQRQLPIRIAATDFARVAYCAGRAREQHPGAGQPPQADPLAPFRAVVEALDFRDDEASGPSGPGKST